MATDTKTTTHKDAVIAECQKIAVLAKELAGASSRFFSAPIYDDDFEAEDGGTFARDLTRLRRSLERAVKTAQGMDPTLDEFVVVDLYK